MTKYDQSWHGRFLDKGAESPRRVLAHIFGLFGPMSYLELGCGVGHWTKAALELGIADTIGIDGPWTSIEALQFSKKLFLVRDLEQPLDLDRRFDLALTLEVAEHLEDVASDTFIATLVRHSDLVVFGAAIPLQGGFKHVNEQWPSYWVPKFTARRYRAFDILRPVFWNDDGILYWHRQNMLVFINEDRPGLIKIARDEAHRLAEELPPMNLVHPERFRQAAEVPPPGMRELLGQIPGAARRMAEKRLLGRGRAKA